VFDVCSRGRTQCAGLETSFEKPPPKPLLLGWDFFCRPLSVTIQTSIPSGDQERAQAISSNMKKASANRRNDDLRSEYDLTRLARGVRGKYYRQAIAGTNLVLIEPELAHVFRDSESVNRALRLLVNTAEAAATRAQNRRRAPKKRLQTAP